MSTPQDPFAPPPGSGGSDEPERGSSPDPRQSPSYGQPPSYGEQPSYDPSPSYGQSPASGGSPGYGQPPGYGPAPSYGQPPGYGAPPAYGTQPYGAAPFGASPAWQGPPLASWGRRVGGSLIDGLISVALTGIVGIVSTDLGNLVSLVVFLYFGWITGTTGQTPGRKLVGISVVREADGTHLGGGAGIGRAFLHFLDALPLLLGYLWPIWDRKNQTFADKLIHSVVIKL